MTTEEMLTGWLVFLLWQDDDEGAVVIPDAVRDAMIERGWIRKLRDDWSGCTRVERTELGARVGDLAAPEWWIDPVPAEES